MKNRMLDRELKKGSAELLILSLVEDQPRHGYDLSKLIEARSAGVLTFRVASLYPLLYRLEQRGWISGPLDGEGGTAASPLLSPDAGRRQRPCITAQHMARVRRSDQPHRRSGPCLSGRTCPRRLRQHLEDRYRELRAAGASEADARRAMAADIEGHSPGDRARLERGRRGRADYGVRSMRQESVVRAVVVATLALGIGANAAIFSVVNAVVLRPLPYRDAGTAGRAPGKPASAWSRRDSRLGGRVRRLPEPEVCLRAGGSVRYDGRQPDRRWRTRTNRRRDRVHRRSSDARRVRRTRADVRPDDERPGRDGEVVVSHSLWTRRFGAIPAVDGQNVTVDRKSAQMIGVMPADFRFPDPAIEIWKPIVLDADAVSDDNRGSHGYTVLARLRSGVSLRQAEADVNALAATFRAEHPEQLPQRIQREAAPPSGARSSVTAVAH